MLKLTNCKKKPDYNCKWLRSGWQNTGGGCGARTIASLVKKGFCSSVVSLGISSLLYCSSAKNNRRAERCMETKYFGVYI
jgi:hypothetical protein